MKEALLTLLQAVIAAAVPVITAFLCNYLNAKKEEAKAITANETVKALIDSALDAVEKAVAVTNQTYVDTLKKSGTFTVENQHEAFQRSYDTAKQLLTKEAAEYIEIAYGGLQEWLTAQIEAQVKASKNF